MEDKKEELGKKMKDDGLRDEVAKAFGRRLKSIRDGMSLTQDEFGSLFGMEGAHIGQFERGEKNPTLKTLFKIANGLKIPLPHLVDFDVDIEYQTYDETTNKIMAYVQMVGEADKEQILTIVKTFKKRK